MKRIIEHLKQNWIKYGFETLVVTVGILAAFGLNNWNEERKLEIQEIQYLKRLKIDLVQDTLYYNKRISDADRALTNNKKAIQMAYKTQHNMKEFQEVMILHSFHTQHLTLQNDTYTEMTNAGNLNIIQNDSLKIATIRLYRASNEAGTHVQEFNEFTVTTLSNMAIVNPTIKYYRSLPQMFEIINDEEKMLFDSD